MAQINTERVNRLMALTHKGYTENEGQQVYQKDLYWHALQTRNSGGRR